MFIMVEKPMTCQFDNFSFAILAEEANYVPNSVI